MHPQLQLEDTIIAPSAPSGGAISLVRLSGPDSIGWTEKVSGKKKLSEMESHTAHFTQIFRKDGSIIDEVVVTVYKNPRSYTRQDIVEVSCHGSEYIVQEILQRYLQLGARMATPGEFTLRAYMNGQMDLAQAESVADLIAAESRKAHELALNQLRGGFSKEIDTLREKLVDFASLIELELDFGEEDVEFADRDRLVETVKDIRGLIGRLIDSFQWGNAVKKGINTVIAGRPNAGKSTLLNALLKEERAIVSEIAGTTRDTIEESIVLEGVQFRLIDTAGIREAADQIEAIGVERTFQKIQQSAVLLFLFDAKETRIEQLKEDLSPFRDQEYSLIVVANKVDLVPNFDKNLYLRAGISEEQIVALSARKEEGLEALTKKLVAFTIAKGLHQSGAVVTNSRHYEALQKADEDLQRVLQGIQSGITSDFVAMDIRQALHHLGSITGEITTDDLLGNIFGKFCIGK